MIEKLYTNQYYNLNYKNTELSMFFLQYFERNLCNSNKCMTTVAHE